MSHSFENAVNGFIGLGREEIVGDLISILYSRGTSTIAETYLNCGKPELATAARAWARKHGYRIYNSRGSHSFRWGEL